MTTEFSALVAIDGHYLNTALHRFSRDRFNLANPDKASDKNNNSPRCRINYHVLKGLLLPEVWGKDLDAVAKDTVELNYYIGFPLLPENHKKMVLGVVKKWQNGFGFIDNNGEDVFVHQTDIVKKGFRSLEINQAVRYIPVKRQNDGRPQAKSVLTQDDYARFLDMTQKRDIFHEMLNEEGYTVVSCRPNPKDPLSKNKSVDMRIVADINSSLSEPSDVAVLLAGDPDYGFLLSELSENDIKTRLVAFKGTLHPELLAVANACKTEVVLLDNEMNKIEHKNGYGYDSGDYSDED